MQQCQRALTACLEWWHLEGIPGECPATELSCFWRQRGTEGASALDEGEGDPVQQGYLLALAQGGGVGVGTKELELQKYLGCWLACSSGLHATSACVRWRSGDGGQRGCWSVRIHHLRWRQSRTLSCM